MIPSVGFKHVDARPIGDFFGETTGIVDRYDGADTGGGCHALVVLTEPGCHVHHAGAFGGVDEVTLEDDESTVFAVMRLLWIDFCHIGEETEQWHIGAAHELGIH